MMEVADESTVSKRRESARRTMLAVAITLPSVVTWLYFVALADASPAAQQAAYSIGKAIQFALPVLWVLVWRERIGFAWPGWRGAPLGAAAGLLLLGAMWISYANVLKPSGLFDGPAAEVRAKIAGMGLASLPLYIALAVFYSLLHSLLEEYYWRWFVFGRLCQALPLTGAIAISSVGFALHHVIVLAIYFGWSSPVTYLFSLGVAIGGAFWAWLYRTSGSLLGPWISHALVDAAIFVIGYDLCREMLR